MGIIAKDAQTLLVELERPIHYFLQIIASSASFLINEKQDQMFPDWYLNAGEHFVSNGPFKLASWEHQHEILLKKNEHHYRAEEIERLHSDQLYQQGNSSIAHRCQRAL